MARANTREEILAAAARQFAAAGYKGTSLQDIAADVGCSKATLLYHFDSKEAILIEMCAPATAELADLVERIGAAPDPGTARTVAVEGFVDLAMRHRKEIQVIYSDLPGLLQQPAFIPVNERTERLLAAVAGPAGTAGTDAALLTARFVLAGLSATPFASPEFDDVTLRAALIEAATRALPPLHG